jgi:hypothetical protein
MQNHFSSIWNQRSLSHRRVPEKLPELPSFFQPRPVGGQLPFSRRACRVVADPGPHPGDGRQRFAQAYEPEKPEPEPKHAGEIEELFAELERMEAERGIKRSKPAESALRAETAAPSPGASVPEQS